MTDQRADKHGLSDQELEAQQATDLPDREAMSLLDLNANINLPIDLTAPVQAGIAANANVAAPIDAAVSANLGSDSGISEALAPQTAIVHQSLDGTATASGTQVSSIDQGGT
jgi:hypothetical protein